MSIKNWLISEEVPAPKTLAEMLEALELVAIWGLPSHAEAARDTNPLPGPDTVELPMPVPGRAWEIPIDKTTHRIKFLNETEDRVRVRIEPKEGK